MKVVKQGMNVAFKFKLDDHVRDTMRGISGKVVIAATEKNNKVNVYNIIPKHPAQALWVSEDDMELVEDKE